MLALREVLIVDDSTVYRTLMTTMMSPQAGRVHAASGVGEALLLLDKHPGIELVLSDVVMEEADGFELLARIQARPEPRPAVVLATRVGPEPPSWAPPDT